jgi:hypothetical protein
MQEEMVVLVVDLQMEIQLQELVIPLLQIPLKVILVEYLPVVVAEQVQVVVVEPQHLEVMDLPQVEEMEVQVHLMQLQEQPQRTLAVEAVV